MSTERGDNQRKEWEEVWRDYQEQGFACYDESFVFYPEKPRKPFNVSLSGGFHTQIGIKK